ncbi:EAL domain-containing protein [Deltaproteobacteria bacterium TL4]
MDVPPLTHILELFPFLEGNETEFVKDLSLFSRVARYKKGELLIQENRINETLYLLVEGRVTMYSGNTWVYTLEGPGEMFGENTIITHSPSPISVEASTDLIVVTVSGNNADLSLQKSFEHTNAVLYRLIGSILTQKLQLTTNRNGLSFGREPFIDKITGCWNKDKFMIDQASADHSHTILAYLKVRKFNEINDGLSFEAGNEVLRYIAETLKTTLPRETDIYHVSGSEFALMFSKKEEEALELMEAVRDKISSEKLVYGNFRIVIKLAIGLASQTSDDMYHHAHLALGESKNQEGRTVFYNRHFDTTDVHLNYLQKAGAIQESFENNMFIPVFQGIRDNRKTGPRYGQIYKFETLMRLKNAGQVLSPFFFMKVLEYSGEMTRATKLVIMKSFDEMFNTDYEFSVNLTEYDLKDESMLDFIKLQLRGNRIEPSRVTFEILENMSLSNNNSATDTLLALRDMGCKLAIDDFGAEQSNIARLLAIRPDYIKIDGIFIKKLPHDENSRIIVETVLELAMRMNTEIIAEFVENGEIQSYLEDIGVHYSQGYHFSKPSETPIPFPIRKK